mgnify:FL=1
MDIEKDPRDNTPFTRAIILHGRPDYDEYYNIQGDSPSNSHWLPWLQQQLLIRGILTQTPEMSRPYEPRYEAWCQEFAHLPVDERTLLVGHSCGGGFLLRWLSEANCRVGRVVLVAPWLDVEGEAGGFFRFTLDRQIDCKAVHGIDVLYSTDDYPHLQSSTAKLRRELPQLRYHRFVDHGHFTFSAMQTRVFPELVEICLREEKK